MRDIIKTGVRLLIITLIAALLLSGTNLLTREPIARHALESQNAARLAVIPGATDFEPVEAAVFAGVGGIGDVREVYKAVKDGGLYGYTFLIMPQGYSSKLPVTVGILSDGRVSGVSIGDISETQGIGTRIKDESFISRFTGIAAEEQNKVDTLSGATISSSAVKRAINEAFTAYSLLGAESETTAEPPESEPELESVSEPEPTPTPEAQ